MRCQAVKFKLEVEIFLQSVFLMNTFKILFEHQPVWMT